MGLGIACDTETKPSTPDDTADTDEDTGADDNTDTDTDTDTYDPVDTRSFASFDDSLTLVHEINLAETVPDWTYPVDVDPSEVQMLLGSEVRVLPHGSEWSAMSYTLGAGLGLEAGKDYLLELSYPDDVSRSMFVINRGGGDHAGLPHRHGTWRCPRWLHQFKSRVYISPTQWYRRSLETVLYPSRPLPIVPKIWDELAYRKTELMS